MPILQKVKYPLALTAIFLLALFFRTYFPYHNVFAQGWVNYQETDCWFNMRIVTDMAQHFPHMLSFDPYGFFPSGMPIYNPPFFYFLLSFVAWVIGLGHPSIHLIETVGAYMPAILGALVIIPVFFISKEIFGKGTGLFAALLIAVLPGQFIWRGMLGFPDYHILEVLLSTTALMFLVLAIYRSGKRMWLFTALSGLFFALYTLTWAGSGLFMAIIFAYIFVQSIINYMRGKPSAPLPLMGIAIFAIALVADLIWLRGAINTLQVKELIIAIIAFASMLLYSKYAAKLPKLLYPVFPILFALFALGLISIAYPNMLSQMVSQLGILSQGGGMMTIAEVQHSSVSMLWQQYALLFYAAILGLGLLLYASFKEETQGKPLLVIWGIVMLAATLGQNRFAYYFAVPVALLSAFLLIKLVSMSKTSIPLRQESRSEIRRKNKKNKRHKKQQAKKQRLSVSPVLVIIVLAVLCATFIPIVPLAIDRVSANTGVPYDWHGSLVWLGNNTPEPLSSLSYYNSRNYPSQEAYQSASYGVMSWWDYGYWITYIAHRIPNANPSQLGAKDAGLFFIAGNETEGNTQLDRLGSKYIIIDYAMDTGKFYAMATWAGKNASDYLGYFYYTDKNGMLQPTMLFFPDYYRSMCSRLYNFDGKAASPANILVVLIMPQQVQGHTISLIKDVKQYNTYAEAQAFLKSNPSYIIAGQNPSQSPVPLEALKSYGLIYSNGSVKIFEYKGETS